MRRDERLEHLARLYALLGELELRVDGRRRLGDCSARDGWPHRGVYFFFEPGELRTGSGSGSRVVRVGTHAIAGNSSTRLWQRLSQHRGTAAGGAGNHRGSIFRLLVGSAIKSARDIEAPASWGTGADPGAAARRLGSSREAVLESERDLEIEVSRNIGAMSVVWLPLDDPPSPASGRALVEQACIALLSDFDKQPIDPPSPQWLGHHSDRGRVRRSGLWNNRHVDETYDPGAL